MKGGIAVLSHATALEFHRAGHDVLVLASALDRDAAREFDREQPFRTVRFSGRLPWRELSILPLTWWHARRFQPDMIWSALWYPAGVAASYVPAPLRTVSTYGSEIFVSTADWKLRLKALMAPWRKRVFASCQKIFALSRYTREKIVELGAPPERIEIVPGGVSEHWFRLQHRPPPPERPVLLTVARLDPHKGHDRVIQALPQILAFAPGLRYVLVGPEAGNWPRLEKLAQDLGVIENVQYCGSVTQEELFAHYEQATVFVMASREEPGRMDLVEGFGLTFLEAGAVGLPCVAGNSGGVPDAVEHEVSGLLVDPESPDAIAGAVLRLLQDPELASRLGRQARERAWAHFRWQHIAARMLQAISKDVTSGEMGRKVLDVQKRISG